MLNNHAIYIYRELRGIPNFRNFRTYKYICVLSFGARIPKNITNDELNHYFVHYGAILSIKQTGYDIQVIYDE